LIYVFDLGVRCAKLSRWGFQGLAVEIPTPPSDYIPLPAVLGLSGPPQLAAAEAGRGGDDEMRILPSARANGLGWMRAGRPAVSPGPGNRFSRREG